MLKQDDYIKGKLVELSWRFLRSYIGTGPVAGQMIMNTIANRVRCGWGGWLQVIDRIPAYMAENEMPPLEHPLVWDATFIKLLQTVDGVFDGSIPDLSCGALYWGDLSKIERDWFKDSIIHARHPEGTPKAGQPVHIRIANTNGLNFWN